MLTLQVIACIGIIKGAFLLFQIRLNDFTGNIFHRLLDAPKGIREEILEETKRRKKSYFRREIEEVQAILKTTDREELFPLLCTASLLLFAAGAAIAVMIGNVFLVPVLACGFLFLPFWYIRLTASHFKRMCHRNWKPHCPLLQRHTCEVRTSSLRWRKTLNI